MSIFNADGEPLMTGAELAFEAALDEQSAAERFEEDFYGDWSVTDEDDDEDEADWLIRHGVGAEDAWIDASEE